MIVFPNCKINLGLNIIKKRDDGYHDLETVFVPAPLKDVLEIIRSPELKFTSSGLVIDGKTENNLCLKAYGLLKMDFPELPSVHIHLHKNIPMGAGLGGGSGDGAFTLMLLNQKFNLRLTNQQLLKYALNLGSDCPFFILNQPCLGTGRGEILEPIPLNLAGYKIVLVNPGIHLSTREAFSKLTPAVPAKTIKEIVGQPIETWKNELLNDFEKPVFAVHPSIAKIKATLYSYGAVYAAMSGSGSTVFGLFKTGSMELPAFADNYMVNLLE